MWVIVIFAKCAKRRRRRIRRKNKEIFIKVWLLVSQEWLKRSCSNLECGLPWVEGTSTVTLVPFESGIKELQMGENCEFVVPVNILTLFVCTRLFWAARHITVCLDSMLCLHMAVQIWVTNLLSKLNQSTSNWGKNVPVSDMILNCWL